MSQQTLTAVTQKSCMSVAILETGDSLDESCVESLMNRIRRLVADGVDVLVFDCSELEYITSFGLSVFLRARKFLREAHGESKKVAAATEPTGKALNGLNGTSTSHGMSSSSETGGTAERVRLVNVSRHVQDILRTACLVQVLPVFDSVQDARHPFAT